MRIVLSLFDGMSCGQIALKELGVTFETYYASEIDKFAISQTKLNFPDTVHLGDINNWPLWNVDWAKVDLILAGSPCQGFSFAGKQLAFDDPRSKLFFVFIEILNHVKEVNPNVKFLLENVRMKKIHQDVITEYTGVNPININSNLVSAQNRNRWYWTNIEGVEQPKDRGIYLRDILEAEVDEKYYLSDTVLKGFANKTSSWKNAFRPADPSAPKDGCVTTGAGSAQVSNNFIKVSRKGSVSPNQDKASCLTGGGNSGGNHSDMDVLLVANKNYRIRRLTPTECSRLQTIPEWYQWGCSDTQHYKMLGNGWTVDVIKHILSYLILNTYG